MANSQGTEMTTQHTEHSEREELISKLNSIAAQQARCPYPIFRSVGVMRQAAALLAATPAREWVGLTEVEQEAIEVIYKPRNGPQSMLNYTRAIESKLREKNAALPAADKAGGEVVAYRYGTALLWPDDAPIGEPDCEPLYTHPQPQALPSDVVKDAERYFPPEFEVWQGDEMCASASGPREEALREAMRYAAQYEQDGPVRVFEVTRTFIDAAMLKEWKNA